ncbi:hypothetical protein E1292_06070 [Nonomuraea deserti]|uniref:PE domain-containing protein n=1 Tax=Nonomuraea deserti TaxID=1848322 RepID=A0A4R4W6D4_9ACTN|nr:hypothetical protein [Nonomuraea deserti]TDD11224.1 hypothetical protein E1292_06070 [Nonomuraea deserti]
MAAELDIDFPLLARYTDGVGDVHGHSQEAARAYLAEMASYGRPWGSNNEVGQAIDMCFGAVHEAYTQCQQDNLEDYASYPDALRRMADVYRSAQDASTAQIRQTFEG